MRWIPMSPSAITRSHLFLQPNPLWTCVWRRRGGRVQGCPSGDGNRMGCKFRGCGQKLGSRNGERGGRRQKGQRQRQTKSGEDNVENLTLGTYINDPLVYAPGLEHYHPIMITLGDNRGKLNVYIYIYPITFLIRYWPPVA